MKNYLIGGLCVVGGLISFANAQTFEIRTQSDGGDYIGNGQMWNFSNASNAKVNTSRSTATHADFMVESFNVSSMNFLFSAGEGNLKPGLYDPAKRDPFRGSYNGIEVYGDGRGCNEILGKFYVHEYEVHSDGTLAKAAIDFAQYCEKGTRGIYGSVRYNSSYANNCDNNGCDAVKKQLNVPLTVAPTTPDVVQATSPMPVPTNFVTTPTSEKEDIQLIKKLNDLGIKKRRYLKATYPAFFRICDINTVHLENGKFNMGVCGSKYRANMVAINKAITNDLGDIELNIDDNDTYSTIFAKSQAKIKTIAQKYDRQRADLMRRRRLTTAKDLELSAGIVYLEIANLGLESLKIMSQ